MNYYEHHLGDYAEATAHLSFVEDAAYSRLMRKCYATEKPLPADIKTVQRLVGARSKDERDAVEAVLAEFWTLTPDGYRNARCEAEIARYQDKQRKAKASADARWAHTERNANASPNAMRTHSEGNALQTPDTIPITEPVGSAAAKSPRPSRKCPESFEPTEPDAFCAAEAQGVDWRAETAKFRDHTFKAARSDWSGTWRNWMRTAAEGLRSVSALSFRERDAQFAAARVREMTGGLVDAKPVGRRADALQEVFDAAPRLVG